MISFVKNLKCISRLNIHYYPNGRYKSYITSLKFAIAGKIFFPAGLDIDRILQFIFMIKYSKFTDNTPRSTLPWCQSLVFNKVAGLRPAALLKKRLLHRCFSVNLSKFLGTPFLQNTSSGCF